MYAPRESLRSIAPIGKCGTFKYVAFRQNRRRERGALGMAEARAFDHHTGDAWMHRKARHQLPEVCDSLSVDRTERLQQSERLLKRFLRRRFEPWQSRRI